MPLYESTLIARHDMSAQQVESLTEAVGGLVGEHGGTIAKSEYWGLRTLAYRIKKNRKGHYLFFNIDAPAATVQALERTLRLNEDVLRYLTVRVETFDTEPSPIMLSRSARDDRSRRRPRPPEPAAAKPAAEKSEGEGAAKSDAESGEKA